jgi:hypothetical protein
MSRELKALLKASCHEHFSNNSPLSDPSLNMEGLRRSNRKRKSVAARETTAIEGNFSDSGAIEVANAISEGVNSRDSTPLSSVPSEFENDIPSDLEINGNYYNPTPKRRRMSTRPSEPDDSSISLQISPSVPCSRIVRLGPIDREKFKLTLSSISRRKQIDQSSVCASPIPITLTPNEPKEQVVQVIACANTRDEDRLLPSEPSTSSRTKKAVRSKVCSEEAIHKSGRYVSPQLERVVSPPQDQELVGPTLDQVPLDNDDQSPATGSSVLPALDHHDMPTPPSSQDEQDALLLSAISSLGQALDDPYLRPISDALYALIRTSEKPESEGHPLVWADSRQELCEALPYFRQLYGGGQTKGGVASGFMFDRQSHPRDYMDCTVTIARAGGGLEKDDETGEMIVSGDQNETAQVSAVMNNIKQFNPVIIVAGGGNSTGPSKIPRTYSVLDHYKPTHVWSEKTKGKRIIRYRFEKLRPEEPSWWKGKDVDEPVKLGEMPPPFKFQCSACLKEHPQVYLNGWMCLNYHCTAFWKLSNGFEPDEVQLRYDPRFLKQHTPWPHSDGMYPIQTESWALSGTDSLFGKDLSWEATRAIVCPDCGRCGSRIEWSVWECKNLHCQRKIELQHKVIPPEAIRDWFQPLTPGYMPSYDLYNASITLRIQFAHNYRINIYTIPGVEGFVAHMIANQTVVEEADGPDDMFVELQTVDADLKRRGMKSGKIMGGASCNHFSSNFGMPYKFVASAQSQSFEAAPKAIQSVRSRLNWARRFLVGDDSEEFNEVLAIGYMEKNAIKVRKMVLNSSEKAWN